MPGTSPRPLESFTANRDQELRVLCAALVDLLSHFSIQKIHSLCCTETLKDFFPGTELPQPPTPPIFTDSDSNYSKPGEIVLCFVFLKEKLKKKKS